MSLDVYLIIEGQKPDSKGSGIFVREDGQNREISRAEWDEKFPGIEPVVFQADDDDEGDEVYSANITHNLANMADKAGIYRHLWRPDEIGIARADQLIEPLEVGLKLLESDPERFEVFNPSNGWGSYDGLCNFVRKYLKACRRFPNASVGVWR
jgi:hypothetical protein